MTTKQEDILQAALALFATESYHATSTSKVAKTAGVSEGLIFRHFINKEGLLKAVLEQGEQRFRQLYANLLFETVPSQVLRRFIELPFSVSEAEYTFWRLQFTLKWEVNYDSSAKIEPVKQALTNAFTQLAYPQPELETTLLMHCMDGVSSDFIQRTPIPSDKRAIKQFLLDKYNL